MGNDKIQKMKKYLRLKRIETENKSDEMLEELYQKVMKKNQHKDSKDIDNKER